MMIVLPLLWHYLYKANKLLLFLLLLLLLLLLGNSMRLREIV